MLLQHYGLPRRHTLNHFGSDTEREFEMIAKHLGEQDVEALVCEHCAKGSKGATNLNVPPKRSKHRRAAQQRASVSPFCYYVATKICDWLAYSRTLVDPEFLPATVRRELEKIGDREYAYETCDVESASRPPEYPRPSGNARAVDAAGPPVPRLVNCARDALIRGGACGTLGGHTFGEAHMIRTASGCVVVLSYLLASASVQAHHSTAGVYDPGKEVTVKGALAKLQFVNPHGSIVVTVKNADGTTTDWTFTTGSATALASQGITKVGPNALKIGEEVTVLGTPARNGSPLGGLKSLTRADGTVLGNAGGN